MALIRSPLLLFLGLLAGLSPQPAAGEIAEHRITSLPGYAKPLATRHWSGYIQTPHVNGSVFTHYWLVENAAKAADAPTLVWMQGGPGGSSMIGLFTENGPLTLNDYSTETAAFNATGIPTVFDNAYSWHQHANMLYVEHPAPTGFSYCTGHCSWDDSSQADTSYAFFVAFFKHYPELAKNPFFFSGESYAGVLVPTVVSRLVGNRSWSSGSSNNDANTAPWSVGGFALGNDCPGNRVFTCTPYSGWIGTQVALDFRFRHGMISEALYAEINAACAGEWGTYDAPKSAKCAKLLEDPVRPVLNEAGDTYEMGGGYFLYDTCPGDDLVTAVDPETHRPRRVAAHEYTVAHLLERREQRREKERKRRQLGQNQQQQEFEVGAVDPQGEFSNDAGTYACGQEKNALVWLNLASVRKAIHVQTKAQSGRAFGFSTGLDYKFTAHSLLDLYKDTLLPAGLRILQYSGDADPCVPYVGTERWVAGLGLETETPWRPWRPPAQPRSQAQGQIGGYVTRYQTGHGSGLYFDFATVRDAGHMAPRYKPLAALHMIGAFLEDKAL
eukprot:g3735.t1